jgi:hypothetical protein
MTNIHDRVELRNPMASRIPRFLFRICMPIAVVIKPDRSSWE